MAGTLVKTTDGLIFAHGFENALVDWSTEVSGSTTATADASTANKSPRSSTETVSGRGSCSGRHSHDRHDGNFV